ncbi:MAG: hypothetical protein M3151_07720 [Actinomycetota bacterium]|nr:hypothetical protein [Actinomycetota bacterium]
MLSDRGPGRDPARVPLPVCRCGAEAIPEALAGHRDQESQHARSAVDARFEQ